MNILFWTLISPVLYTYLIYPILTIGLGKWKKSNNQFFVLSDIPTISILIAAYNEELVIENKIKSILESEFPVDKYEVIIGTDQCTDQTDIIVEKYAQQYEHIKHIKFNNRSGKIKIINSLAGLATGELFIITDANVFFTEKTIGSLTKHFKNETIGLVDSNMKNYGMKSSGISIPEKAYISIEGKLKNAEGKLWGTMMGPFGGCFAIRKSLFTLIPENYLVDDFFINMSILQRGYLCINEPNAIVYEDVSNDLKSEFNRKLRISTGNFQNLTHFARILLKFNRISFTFLSHKILRWFSPFFILFSGIVLIFIFNDSMLNFGLFMTYLAILGIVLLDLILLYLGIHFKLFRYLTHFVSMNAALFIGFFKYLKGTKSSIWQRTERLQK